MGLTYILEKRFSCCGSERKPNGSQELLIVKRFGKERRSSCVQRRGTNQWIFLSGKDDNAGRRRNLAKVRLNLQPVHLWHMNVNQGNHGAMSSRITQELLGISKHFCRQIS
jgi:hypothetical protein